MFPVHNAVVSGQHSNSTLYDGDRQENIIRNDKLLTDGSCNECITHPDSSESDYRASSSSKSRGSNPTHHCFTLNQNVHDSLLNSSANYPPPPPMTCMAPLRTNGSSLVRKVEPAFLTGISKIETTEPMLNDGVGLGLSSPPSSSWLGRNKLL